MFDDETASLLAFSSLEVDSSVPLTHHDPKDLGLICLVMKRKIYFRILSDFRIQSWIFLKKRTPSLPRSHFLDVTQRSHKSSLGGTLHDIQKTAPRETTIHLVGLSF